jgi:hypothetical protein
VLARGRRRDPRSLLFRTGDSARRRSRAIGDGVEESRDPGDGRTVLFPTAFTAPKGQLRCDIVDLGYWDIAYAVTDSVEVGVRTGPPIGGIAVLPQAKYSYRFDGGAVAVEALGGVVAPYVTDAPKILIAGGGPKVTLGTPDRYLNVGVEAYAVNAGSDSLGLVLPYVGGSIRLSARLRLGGELLVPIAGRLGEGAYAGRSRRRARTCTCPTSSCRRDTPS